MNTVSAIPQGAPATYYLPMDDVDRADEITMKALAIIDLMQVAGDGMQPRTASAVAWILRDLVGELGAIANRMR